MQLDPANVSVLSTLHPSASNNFFITRADSEISRLKNLLSGVKVLWNHTVQLATHTIFAFLWYVLHSAIIDV